jgi:hypothetical protein
MTAGLFFLVVIGLIAIIVWTISRLAELGEGVSPRQNRETLEHGKCGSRGP